MRTTWTTSSPCDELVLENIYEQEGKRYRLQMGSRRTLRELTYCPSRWRSSVTWGFNLAYANTTQQPFDQEHLIEVVGIVESVSADGSGSTWNGRNRNKRNCISGKVSFDTWTICVVWGQGVLFMGQEKSIPCSSCK